jgi:hypothetical protein
MAMEGWSWQPALLTLGAAALLARLLFFGGRRSESSAQLGSPPPAAFDRAADRVTAARRVEGAQKMRTLGPPPRAQELVDGMASGSLTVEGVVGDMLERARVAHEMTHAVVPCKPLEADGSVRTADDDKYNPLGADALTRAKELDGYDRRRRGPLHGLPFSVKECFQLQGTDSTAGLGKFKSQDGVADRTPTRNAPLIDALLDAGAVPIAKTNVPQLMYSFECENPIYGRTSTPSSELLIPGGSSGGEAALIASGGSVVGIGTDIGGSCRTPAHMSGCCGANIAFLESHFILETEQHLPRQARDKHSTEKQGVFRRHQTRAQQALGRPQVAHPYPRRAVSSGLRPWCARSARRRHCDALPGRSHRARYQDYACGRSAAGVGSKNAFTLVWRHFKLKLIIIPRQARDKHRVNGKPGAFCAGALERRGVPQHAEATRRMVCRRWLHDADAAVPARSAGCCRGLGGGWPPRGRVSTCRAQRYRGAAGARARPAGGAGGGGGCLDSDCDGHFLQPHLLGAQSYCSTTYSRPTTVVRLADECADLFLCAYLIVVCAYLILCADLVILCALPYRTSVPHLINVPSCANQSI